MPSVAVSDKWFVRVDGNKEDLIEMLKEVRGWIDCQRMLALFHMGATKENPHCHFVIDTFTRIQKQSFDVRIKKIFKIEKKSQWSTKIWDGGDSACSYMFHESGNNIIANKGFTEEDISRFEKLNESVQKVVAINNARAPGRQADKVVDEFKDESPTKKDIFDVFMIRIRDGEMYEPGDFQLAKLVEEVYLKTRTKEQWKDYVEDRFHKIFLSR